MLEDGSFVSAGKPCAWHKAGVCAWVTWWFAGRPELQQPIKLRGASTIGLAGKIVQVTGPASVMLSAAVEGC